MTEGEEKTADGERPELPQKKSDEEALAEGNEKPELPPEINGFEKKTPSHVSGSAGEFRPE